MIALMIALMIVVRRARFRIARFRISAYERLAESILNVARVLRVAFSRATPVHDSVLIHS